MHAHLSFTLVAVTTHYTHRPSPQHLQVVFHGKCIPWFVSDVNITDFSQTLTACQLPHPPSLPGVSSSSGVEPQPSWGAVARLGKRWGEHVAAGELDLSYMGRHGRQRGCLVAVARLGKHTGERSLLLVSMMGHNK